MILLIDNYDSFTYNLCQYIEMLGARCRVVRNDEIALAEIEDLSPSRIVLSPGPGRPGDAGITLSAVSHFAGRIPILGVCLGHQAIGEAFGGKVIRAPMPCHGKLSTIHHVSRNIFSGIANPMTVARYHSLMIDEESLPPCLEVTARTDDGLIMGIRHREFEIEGVQFHPESVATDHGLRLMRNFLDPGERAYD